MRIVRLVTDLFFFLHQLRSQIDAMVAAGHEVIVIASPIEGTEALGRIPEIVRAEDQDLLLRSYSASRFACLPEVQMGYRQTQLSLKTVLTARKHLALVQWSVNLQQGRPIHAVLGFLAFAIKALADAAIGVAGARHLFITRMARDAPQDEIDRWKKVWGEIRQSSDDAPSASRAARTVT